jgi:hypothetical protein
MKETHTCLFAKEEEETVVLTLNLRISKRVVPVVITEWLENRTVIFENVYALPESTLLSGQPLPAFKGIVGNVSIQS